MILSLDSGNIEELYVAKIDDKIFDYWYNEQYKDGQIKDFSDFSDFMGKIIWLDGEEHTDYLKTNNIPESMSLTINGEGSTDIGESVLHVCNVFMHPKITIDDELIDGNNIATEILPAPSIQSGGYYYFVNGEKGVIEYEIDADSFDISLLKFIYQLTFRGHILKTVLYDGKECEQVEYSSTGKYSEYGLFEV